MAGYRWEGADLVLHLQIQPRSSKDEFAGLLGERIKLRLTAPPVDGKANAQLVKFLAKTFRVAKSEVELLSGETSRQKTVRIRAPRAIPDATGIQPRASMK